MKNAIIGLLNWLNEKPQSHFLFYLSLFLLLIPLIHYQAYANDLWKTLYSGRYLALNWSFPSHAEFAFSQVVEVVARDTYNWLGNLVFFGLHRFGGISALQIVLRMGLVIFAIVLTHSIINYKLNPLVLLMLFFLVVNQFQKLLLRTAIFIIPFMIIFWWLWNRAREKGQWRWLWGFPVLFLFWGNMHGSYLKGFCFLLVVFIGDFIDKFIDDKHPGWPWLGRLALIVFFVFIIITFIKPFPDYQATNIFLRTIQTGTGGFVSTEETTLNLSQRIENGELEITDNDEQMEKHKNPEIQELGLYEQIKRFLQNLIVSGAYEKRMSGEFSFPADNLHFIYVLPSFLIIAITLFSFIINYRAITAREFLVWLAATLLGSAFMRTLPIVTLVMMPLLFWKYQRGDFADVKVGNWIHLVAMAGCVLAAANLWYLNWNGNIHKAVGTSYHRAGFGKHPRFSDAVSEYTLANYAGQKGYNDYDMGAYLIWKWWPKKRVFIDSKSSAYSPDFLEEYMETYNLKLISKYEFDHAVVPYRSSMIYTYLIPHTKWEIEAMDESMILFRKVKEAKSKHPSEYLLLSVEELNRLHRREKRQLQRVMKFIVANQNNMDKFEKFLNLRHWELEMVIEEQENKEN